MWFRKSRPRRRRAPAELRPGSLARSCMMNAEAPSSPAGAKPSASAWTWVALATASAPPATPAAHW
eukprot:6583509-Alexandrium_andersonii.AAC.1